MKWIVVCRICKNNFTLETSLGLGGRVCKKCKKEIINTQKEKARARYIKRKALLKQLRSSV